MKTQKIKWDKGMAVRCLARVRDTSHDVKDNAGGYVRNIPEVSSKPCCRENDFWINISKGEWDDFQSSISTIVRKKHR